MEEGKAKRAAEKAKPIDKKAFVSRKLGVMNQKQGPKFERNAARVVENNR